ncbi:endonuclease domain-containing protein [Rhodopseudomonas sp. B29]|uniref:endonuclease domain-containing protein n=1 Tax=Rhodopseudomonas sp. B29 TaxID=95607 RepID=UPI000A05A935|nr:endonuclease domain-containing protein [Rhodopseudomonas sp. B29]
MIQRVPNQQRQFAKQLRTNATDAERALWKLLRSRRLSHLKFRRQVPLGSWIVDFVCFERRLIVEADGSQHADSDHDAMRDRDLHDRGFRVLRYWNNDILLRSDAVIEAIAQAAAPNPSPVCAPDGAHPPSPTRGEGKNSE